MRVDADGERSTPGDVLDKGSAMHFDPGETLDKLEDFRADGMASRVRDGRRRRPDEGL